MKKHSPPKSPQKILQASDQHLRQVVGLAPQTCQDRWRDVSSFLEAVRIAQVKDAACVQARPWDSSKGTGARTKWTVANGFAASDSLRGVQTLEGFWLYSMVTPGAFQPVRRHNFAPPRQLQPWLPQRRVLGRVSNGAGDDLHEGIDRGIRLWDKVLLCASKSSLARWWMDGEINRAFQKEAQISKERGQNAKRGLRSAERPGEAGRKVLALIPLNLDGFLFSADYQSGKKAEIKSRVAANFVGWEKDHALFDRELEKVIRALRTDEGGREKPPPPKL